MRAKKPGISLCMIVKDEEALIEGCLQSVQGVVDEIVVVDTGSADRTMEIARRHGARVYSHPWEGSFSKARNHSLRYGRYTWALLLDADERLYREDRQALIDFTKNTELDGAHFKVLNYVGAKKSGQYTVHNALRLVRNNDLYCFRGEIHEQIARTDGKSPKGRFTITEIRLEHLGYLDSITAKKDKRSRNIPMLEHMLAENPHDAFSRFNLGNEYMAQNALHKAIACYDQAIWDYQPTEAYAPHLHFRKAMCLYLLKAYPQAVEAVLIGLKIFPACTDLEFLQGQIYMDWRRDTLAICCFERALAMGEPPLTLRFSDGCATTRPALSLALIYKRNRDYVRAMQYFSKALSYDSNQYSAIYGIAECMKKLGVDQEHVQNALSSLFADASYAPNRILLADVLLSQMLIAPAKRQIESLENETVYAFEKEMLRGKHAYYSKDAQSALAIFGHVLTFSEGQKILPAAKNESALLFFAASLILGDEAAANRAVLYIEKHFGAECAQIAREMFSLSQGKAAGELTAINYARAESFIAAVLRPILKAQEFALFEKLLYIYNALDSKNVLLSLACDVYYPCDFTQMAAQTILRSIRELDTITPDAARLLAEIYDDAHTRFSPDTENEQGISANVR